MNIVNLLRENASKFPDKVFLLFEGMEMTYAEFLDKVNRLANGMDSLGIQKRDKIGSFSTVFDYVRPGGTVSLVGVYNEAVHFPIFKYWWKNLTIRMGLVETHRMDQLIEWIGSGRIDTRFPITHTLPFDDIMKGYEIAEDRSRNALKVAISLR